MAIVKCPQTKSVDAFISCAPDALPAALVNIAVLVDSKAFECIALSS
jgi:hypothetical protein